MEREFERPLSLVLAAEAGKVHQRQAFFFPSSNPIGPCKEDYLPPGALVGSFTTTQ